MENASSLGEDNDIVANLHDNIKWGGGRNDSDLIKFFLQQYSLQCLAEAIARGAEKVYWAYSFPEAFSGSENTYFDTLWTKTLLSTFNSVSENISSASNITSKTESVSMSQYFTSIASSAIITGPGIICYDIGGGSTDIAIWQNDNKKAKYQCSLKFAGRNILGDYLYLKKKNNEDLLDSLSNRDRTYSEQLRRVCESNGADFSIQLEALLKYHEEMLFDGISANSSDGDFNVVLRDIAFALGGIFFYTGNVLAYLIQNKVFKIDDQLPNCYVGGNASKLFRWAAKGNEKLDIIKPLLLDCFYNGLCVGYRDIKKKLSPDDLEINLECSMDPKEEVAFGLVCKTYDETKKKKKGTVNPHVEVDDMMADMFKGFDDDKSSDADDFFDEDDNDEDIKTGTLQDGVVCGEAFTFMSEDERSSCAVIGSEKFDTEECEIRVHKSLAYFRMYLQVFNTCLKVHKLFKLREIKFEDSDLRQIRNTVNRDLSYKYDDFQRDTSLLVLEPVFIMELRSAMQILGDFED